jgi:hypothetical protein
MNNTDSQDFQSVQISKPDVQNIFYQTDEG